MSKNAQTTAQFTLISHASKVMLKILQAWLQQYMNFQIVNLDLEKAEEPEIKLPTSAGSLKKQKSSRKTGVRQGLILSPCLFNLYAEYIREMLGWKKHKLESRLPGEIPITSDMQVT